MLTPRLLWKAEWTAVLGLALWTLLMHHSVLQDWWYGDDPANLRHAVKYSPAEYYFVPHNYRELSAASLTPWITLSLDFDLRAFGLRPGWFYAHQLLVSGLAAILTFLLLRLHLSRSWALAGAALLPVGAPAALTAAQLMTRHYVEGLGLFVAAMLLYVLALRGNRLWQAWLGAGFFLLATTAKEIFLPLPLFLLIWPTGGFRRNCRFFLPYWLVIALYLPWRRYMLGQFLGGYGAAGAADPSAIFRGFLGIPGLLFGNGWSLWLALIPLLLLGTAALIRRQLPPMALLIGLILLLTPLAPLAVWPGITAPDRYLLLPWWALVCASAFAAGRLATHSRRAAILGGLGLLILAGVAWRQTTRERLALDQDKQEFAAQGRFLWEEGSRGRLMLVSPRVAAAYWYIVALAELRQWTLPEQPVARAFSDEIQLQELPPGPQVWSYRPECRCMKDISADFSALMNGWRNRLAQKPISVSMRYDGTLVYWEFGPYRDGNYSLVSETLGRWPLPFRGQTRADLQQRFTFRLRYDAPEGWITYSPVLSFDPSARGPLEFRQP